MWVLLNSKKINCYLLLNNIYLLTINIEILVWEFIYFLAFFCKIRFVLILLEPIHRRAGNGQNLYLLFRFTGGFQGYIYFLGRKKIVKKSEILLWILTEFNKQRIWEYFFLLISFCFFSPSYFTNISRKIIQDW